MDLQLLQTLNAERAARRAVVVATRIPSGEQRILRESEIDGQEDAETIRTAIASGRSGTIETPGGPVFLNVHAPPPRILVIGAVHISQALAPMARIAGYDVAIVDPRTAFATAERFPDVVLSAEWPEIYLDATPLDPYTALVAVTHDPKIDDLPLRRALETGCFYVGALGSRKTHARRVERLVAAGVPEHLLSRIDAPIGLDIAASSPGEIAVAVLGGVIAAFRRRKMHADRRGETERA